jgi:hypothetical protein
MHRENMHIQTCIQGLLQLLQVPFQLKSIQELDCRIILENRRYTRMGQQAGEPEYVHEALSNEKWRGAMDEEYRTLLRNGTCHLVPSHHTNNTIDCKWVYKIKRKQDGSVDMYKARLVTKGFRQRFGIDYSDMFILAIKSATIHLMLSLAVSRGW